MKGKGNGGGDACGCGDARGINVGARRDATVGAGDNNMVGDAGEGERATMGSMS